MKKKTFPVEVRRGSTVVKIYRLKHKSAADGFVFDVKWYVGRQRLAKQFTSLTEAEEHARLKAAQLAAGKLNAAESLTADDALVLARARTMCESTPILTALEEWREARALCGHQLIPAAKAWRDANLTPIRTITVPEAVAAFLTAKDRANVNTKSSYRSILPRVAARLTGPIGSVSTQALDACIHEEFKVTGNKHAHPVTFNTARKRLVTLWGWCRKQGYLPRNAKTEAESLECAREPSMEIGICTLKEYARLLVLLRDQYPAHLGAGVLAGFCGLRRSEVHVQSWADVELDRKFVRVTKAKTNTPSKRLVNLSDAAVEWLLLCDRSGERVAPPWGVDRVRTIAREAGIKLPENAFRHSFISYRVARTGDVAGTSLEAGNSPKIIHSNYRELVTQDDGLRWFELTPDAAAALAKDDAVPFPAAATKRRVRPSKSRKVQ